MPWPDRKRHRFDSSFPEKSEKWCLFHTIKGRKDRLTLLNAAPTNPRCPLLTLEGLNRQDWGNISLFWQVPVVMANPLFYSDGVTRRFIVCFLFLGVGIVAVKRVRNHNITDTCAHTSFLPPKGGWLCPNGFRSLLIFIFEPFLSIFGATRRTPAMLPPSQKTPGSAEFSVWRGESCLDST